MFLLIRLILVEDSKPMNGDDQSKTQDKKDRDAGQNHLPEENRPINEMYGRLQILPSEPLDDLLPVVVQEEDEEEYDGDEDVIEEPPLHCLHVGGCGQRIVDVRIESAHH